MSTATNPADPDGSAHSPEGPAQPGSARVPTVSRARSLGWLLGAGGVVVGLAFALRIRDPHVPGSWGYCPTALLGFDCPLCGGLRGVNDLMHGEFVAAASSNLLLVTVGPLVVLWWLVQVQAAARGKPVPVLPRLRRWQLVLLLGGVLAFTVLRNLPGSWLAA